MKKTGVFLVLAALAIGGSVACSSGFKPAAPAPGTLPPGTAHLTVDNRNLGQTEALRCVTVDWWTVITTGDDAAGATALLSNAGELTTELVRIRNLNGFSGDYNRGLDGSAVTSARGPTYDISGAVMGYGVGSIRPVTKPFATKVSC